MAAGHAHSHGIVGGKLRTAFLLTLVILAVEASAGVLSHSLALLSDAGHVLTDIFALGLAWFGAVQAERPADARNTYGYHRTGILAALANAVTLIVIVLVIGYQAVQRFQHPEAVTPWLMFVSAAFGIAINLYIGFRLRQESGDNLNVRAAMLHVFGDVGASAGVIVAGAIILFTGWYPADPLLSLAIAALIAKGAWSILRETVDILMEATPRDLNVAQLVRDLVRIPEIEDVHDLHVWSIAGGMRVLSAHIQVSDDCSLSACDALQSRINGLLLRNYQIGHTTLQFECAACDPNPLYCALHGGGNGGHDHQQAHGSDSHTHGDHGHEPALDGPAMRRGAGTTGERKR
ncbi:MAG TPA: cation diffusion facilitator family transporter [Chloroflexota bacterium]|jgi:cobalt-zinc-cadmium efflux system protein|nr:cation diffusion facilitator family transporter [Chloroflexota bacterium]